LAYQPPASSIFLSEQTSHQQPASSTLLSEQTSTSHQHEPTEQALGFALAIVRTQLAEPVAQLPVGGWVGVRRQFP
jgi:hypothetical protein